MTAIPELRESEDERIRKCICMALTDVDEQRFKDFGTTLKDCLAYLERQKEQKPISSCDIVPYIDDAIAALQDMWREEKIAFDWDDMHEMIEDVARHFYQKEQKPAWSEEDERILTGIIERGSVQVPPYTTALREEQIEWLMNRLKSLRPQPKQEWSEEDEKMLKWLEDILSIADADLSDKLHGEVHAITDSAYSSMKLCIAKCRSWLNNLRPKYHGDVTMTEEYKMGLEAGRESGLRDGQKYVLDNAESYGLCKPADWLDEYEKDNIYLLLCMVDSVDSIPYINGTLRVSDEKKKELKEYIKRPSWKPSEEQMAVLLNAEGLMRANDYKENAKILAEVIEELKKLCQ